MKFQLIRFISLFGFVLISLSSIAQSFVTLSSGISKDINNTKPFYHTPVSLQWKPFPKASDPFLLEVDYHIPLTNTGSADAYTVNAALPQQVNLRENIRSYIFTTSVGLRIFLFSTKTKNDFYLNLLTGYCNQKFKVEYVNYDKGNYEVLNPDVNTNKGGFVFSTAVVYNFNTANRNLQLMLHIQTPLLIERGRYPLSYKFAAPLQLTFGYNFYYKK